MQWLTGLSGGPRRVNHAAVALGDSIFSFGGYSADDAASTSSALEEFPPKRPIDVHVLNTTTLRWRRRPTPTCEEEQYYHSPYQRYGHTVVAWQGKAYVFGGRSDPDGSCNEVFEYWPAEHRFAMLETGQSEEEVPGARDGHSAVVAGDDMIIFGGFIDEEQVYGHDVWAFHLRRHRWRQIRAEGQMPTWRDFHTATMLADGRRMLVFGGRSDDLSPHGFGLELYDDGLYCLDLVAKEWSSWETSGDRPTGRRSHTAWLEPQPPHRVFFYGGYNGLLDLHYGELRALNPTSRSWELVKAHGVGPGARRRQATVQLGSRLFLFGGTKPARGVDAEAPNGPESGENESVLADLDDLHVLDFCPSLATLAAQVVIRVGLSREGLPRELAATIRYHSEPNNVLAIKARSHSAAA